MTTKLAVYNGALEHLGSRPLAALTEVGQARRALDAAWDNAVQWCLEAGQWRFAKRSVALDYSANITPQYGYDYAFEIPTDHVRLCGLWPDPNLRRPLEDYREEAGLWFANEEILYISYVSNDVNYGLDLGAWPSRFVELVEVHLAFKTALNITSSTEKRDACRALRDKTILPHAASIDAMQDPTRRFPIGSWVRARRGTGWRRLDDGQVS